jgi:hypothetical protein
LGQPSKTTDSEGTQWILGAHFVAQVKDPGHLHTRPWPRGDALDAFDALVVYQLYSWVQRFSYHLEMEVMSGTHRYFFIDGEIVFCAGCDGTWCVVDLIVLPFYVSTWIWSIWTIWTTWRSL